MMTNTRMEEIAAHARQAAMRVRSGWNVLASAPNSYTEEEAELWEEWFKRELGGGS